VSRLVRNKLVGEQVVSITLAYVPLDLILPGISRIAQYGPVCCVVWEGRPVRVAPIPIAADLTMTYASLDSSSSYHAYWIDNLVCKFQIVVIVD